MSRNWTIENRRVADIVNRNEVGRIISRAEALEISRRTLERAEAERSAEAEREAGHEERCSPLRWMVVLVMLSGGMMILILGLIFRGCAAASAEVAGGEGSRSDVAGSGVNAGSPALDTCGRGDKRVTGVAASDNVPAVPSAGATEESDLDAAVVGPAPRIEAGSVTPVPAPHPLSSSLAWLDAHEPLTVERWGKRFLLERAIAEERPIYDVVCTAYLPGTSDCPGTTTATGTRAVLGVVAVHQSALREWAGTILWCEGYGIARVEDSGSFYWERGAPYTDRKLDFVVSSWRELRDFSVKPRRVVVLAGPGLSPENLKYLEG